jgi:hypothetical protein
MIWDIKEESDFVAKYWKCRKCKKDVIVVYDEDIGNLWELEKEGASDRQAHSYPLKFNRSGSHLRWSTPHAKDLIGLCEMGSVDSLYSMLSFRPDTDAYQIDPEEKFQAQLIEPNHWSRSSYTSTVLVGRSNLIAFCGWRRWRRDHFKPRSGGVSCTTVQRSKHIRSTYRADRNLMEWN